MSFISILIFFSFCLSPLVAGPRLKTAEVTKTRFYFTTGSGRTPCSGYFIPLLTAAVIELTSKHVVLLPLRPLHHKCASTAIIIFLGWPHTQRKPSQSFAPQAISNPEINIRGNRKLDISQTDTVFTTLMFGRKCAEGALDASYGSWINLILLNGACFQQRDQKNF